MKGFAILSINMKPFFWQLQFRDPRSIISIQSFIFHEPQSLTLTDSHHWSHWQDSSHDEVHGYEDCPGYAPLPQMSPFLPGAKHIWAPWDPVGPCGSLANLWVKMLKIGETDGDTFGILWILMDLVDFGFCT